MNNIRFAKQVAVAAGFLALSLTPGISRAQSSSQAPASQDQNQAAQATPTPRGTHKHGEMAGLNLTDDQKAQMKQIHQTTKSQIEAVSNDASLSADQKQAKIHEIRHDARKQMVGLLTPEQRQQMKENARARRAARKEQQPQQPQQTQPQAQ